MNWRLIALKNHSLHKIPIPPAVMEIMFSDMIIYGHFQCALPIQCMRKQIYTQSMPFKIYLFILHFVGPSCCTIYRLANDYLKGFLIGRLGMAEKKNESMKKSNEDFWYRKYNPGAEPPVVEEKPSLMSKEVLIRSPEISSNPMDKAPIPSRVQSARSAVSYKYYGTPEIPLINSRNTEREVSRMEINYRYNPQQQQQQQNTTPSTSRRTRFKENSSQNTIPLSSILKEPKPKTNAKFSLLQKNQDFSNLNPTKQEENEIYLYIVDQITKLFFYLYGPFYIFGIIFWLRPQFIIKLDRYILSTTITDVLEAYGQLYQVILPFFWMRINKRIFKLLEDQKEYKKKRRSDFSHVASSVPTESTNLDVSSFESESDDLFERDPNYDPKNYE